MSTPFSNFLTMGGKSGSTFIAIKQAINMYMDETENKKRAFCKQKNLLWNIKDVVSYWFKLFENNYDQ